MSKRIIRVIVPALLVLGGCGFAVWEILIFVRCAQSQPISKTLSDGTTDKKIRTSDTGAISPMELMKELERPAGLFRKTSSAPPVVPPKGAKQILAVGRKTIRDGYVELQWSYKISDDEKTTIAHYTEALKKKGFVLRNEKRKARRVGMVFHRYPVAVTLSLRPSAGKENLLNVTVCENRPRHPADFSKIDRGKTE